MAVLVVCSAAAPATDDTLALAGGKLRLTRPASYELMSQAADGLQVSLRAGAGNVLVSLSVVKLSGNESRPEVRKLMLARLLEELRTEGRNMGAEVLTPAAIKEVGGLYCKVADVIHVGGKTGRTIGRAKEVRLITGVRGEPGYVVTMFVAVTAEDEAARDKAFADAEDKLLKAIEVAPDKRSGTSAAPATKPAIVSLKKAVLRFTVPEGYVVRTEDKAEGVLATLTNGPRRVLITAVKIEPTAGSNARDADRATGAALEKVLEVESSALDLPGPVGEYEPVQDARFLRRQRRTGGPDDARWVSDTRQIKLAGLVISVAMYCPVDDEGPAAKAADGVAESLAR